nr:hypothetical protein [Tanacetum cinerariifolium]
MESVQISSDPAPECQTMALEQGSLSPGQSHAENDQVADDEFINIFSTPMQDQGETSSRHVMVAPTIPISAEENLGDPIDIRVDIIYPVPVAVVTFPAAAVIKTRPQHGEAIRGTQKQLLGVPIQEELTALRFRVDIAEVENASLRARIKTTEAIEKITRNQ